MGTVGESTIERPIALANKRPNGITIKSPAEFELMKAAGKVVAEVKALVQAAVRPGVTTENLDALAENAIRAKGAIPSFKNYLGYPKSICTSINDEIVHGIPSQRLLNEGDLLSVDIGAIFGGLHADSAFSIGVGEINQKAQDLIDATRESLRRGIEQVKIGARIGDISAAVQTYAEGEGYELVRHYVGHGIGYAMHEDPSVPNFGEAGRGPLLREGMAIAIEPMLNLGTRETNVKKDKWTVVTADGQWSAHFEDTVLVTQDGPVVTTTQWGQIGFTGASTGLWK